MAQRGHSSSPTAAAQTGLSASVAVVGVDGEGKLAGAGAEEGKALEVDGSAAGGPPAKGKEVAVLPDDDASEQEKGKVVSYFTLFRFADRLDFLLMALGFFGAAANGAAMPVFSIIFGNLLNSFGFNQSNLSVLRDATRKYSLYFVYLGIGERRVGRGGRGVSVVSTQLAVGSRDVNERGFLANLHAGGATLAHRMHASVIGIRLLPCRHCRDWLPAGRLLDIHRCAAKCAVGSALAALLQQMCGLDAGAHSRPALGPWVR